MLLESLLEQCQADTKRIIGTGAANSIPLGRGYTEEQYIAFIKHAIDSPHNKANGFIINHKGGLSLEDIVLDQRCLNFNGKDRGIARETLKLPPESE